MNAFENKVFMISAFLKHINVLLPNGVHFLNSIQAGMPLAQIHWFWSVVRYSKGWPRQHTEDCDKGRDPFCDRFYLEETY